MDEYCVTGGTVWMSMVFLCYRRDSVDEQPGGSQDQYYSLGQPLMSSVFHLKLLPLCDRFVDMVLSLFLTVCVCLHVVCAFVLSLSMCGLSVCVLSLDFVDFLLRPSCLCP